MKADHAQVARLLKTARGQIDGILKMVEEDRYCLDAVSYTHLSAWRDATASEAVSAAAISSGVRPVSAASSDRVGSRPISATSRRRAPHTAVSYTHLLSRSISSLMAESFSMKVSVWGI